MTWGCAHVDDYEDDRVHIRQNRNGQHVELMAQSLSQSIGPGFCKRSWARFTLDFTQREVTYATDTFPAMAGIVRRIQERTEDTYYAGIWKSHFLEGLLWRWEQCVLRLLPNEGIAVRSRELSKRQKWTAPSWSWVSVKGKIQYHRYLQNHGDYLALLEECNVTCAGLDPFGALTAGFARITGPVTLITDVEPEVESPKARHLSGQIQLGNGTSSLVEVAYDSVHHESCSALMITAHLGICIEKVEETTDTYIRVGTVYIHRLYVEQDGPDERTIELDLTALDHVPPRTVVLV